MLTTKLSLEPAATGDSPDVPNLKRGLLFGAMATVACIPLWGGVVYLFSPNLLAALFVAMAVGFLIAWASMHGFGHINRPVQVAIAVFTSLAAVGGEIIYFSLDILVDQRAAINLENMREMIPVVAKGLWRLEKLGLRGFIALPCALLSAHYSSVLVDLRINAPWRVRGANRSSSSE